MSRNTKGSTSGVGKKDDKEKCRDCNKAVLEGDSGIQCEVCSLWFHTGCQKMSEDIYKVLAKNSDFIHWYCDGCNRGVAKVLQSLSNLQVRQDKVEDDVEKVKNDIQMMKDDVAHLKQVTVETETKLETAIEAKLLESVDRRVEDRVVTSVNVIRQDVNEQLEMKGVSAIWLFMVYQRTMSLMTKRELMIYWDLYCILILLEMLMK